MQGMKLHWTVALKGTLRLALTIVVWLMVGGLAYILLIKTLVAALG